ncbi:MAG: DUF2341 domain-containing protein [Spirochaetales bacterium]|nr:DUF2341 domain-containing protein [Spirochaetales bacterium]
MGSRVVSLAALLVSLQCAHFDAQSYYAGLLLNSPSSGGSSGSVDALKAQGWTKRLKINALNASSAESFTDFPLLVHLDSTRISYGDTENSGADVRFTDSSGALLDYQLERWNESGTSTVWVRMPAISASSDEDYLYFYYGNPSASASESASSIWTDNYRAVWHFTEQNSDPAPQFKDSSSYGHHGTATGMGAAARTGSLVGYGQNFVGSGHVNVTDTTHLRLTNDFTLESLFQWNGGGGSYGYVIEKGQNDDDNYALFFTIAGGRLATEYQDSAGTYRNPTETPATSVTSGTYVFAAVTYDRAALRFRFYKNGILTATVAAPGGNPIAGDQTFDLRIGRQDFGGGNFYFYGTIDDVAISSARRSDEYLLARNKSFRDTFLQYGSPEDL